MARACVRPCASLADQILDLKDGILLPVLRGFTSFCFGREGGREGWEGGKEGLREGWEGCVVGFLG